MHRTKIFAGRVMCAVAAAFFLSFMTSGTALAQLRGGGDDDVEYDVKASSGTLDNNNGEFPLNYSVEYDDGDLEDISLDPTANIDECRASGVSDQCLSREVRQRLTTRPGRNPIAIWMFNIRIPIGHDIACTFPDRQGGCWCLCLKWLRVSWWPWQVRPIYIWYYDPCCR